MLLLLPAGYNKFSLSEQVKSVQKLLAYDWAHVIPGHGRRWAARDALHRLQAVSNLAQRYG